MSSASHPLAIRPLPAGNKKPKTLGEFIARVNAEGSSFRNLTEEGLRLEIEAQEKHGIDANDTEMTDALDGDEDEGKAPQSTKVEDLVAARQEVLRNVE